MSSACVGWSDRRIGRARGAKSARRGPRTPEPSGHAERPASGILNGKRNARPALEPVAARLTALRLTDDHLRELIALGERLQEASLAMNPPMYNPTNRAFHNAIARYAQSTFLADDIDHIQALNHWRWNIYFAQRGTHRADFVPHETAHRDLIAAFSNRDAPAAEEAMRADILRSRDQLIPGL